MNLSRFCLNNLPYCHVSVMKNFLNVFLPHCNSRITQERKLGMLKRFSSVIFLVLFGLSGLYSQATPEVGETLFKNYCATCHNKNMKDDLTGPALGGAEQRWADYPPEELYAWIRNSGASIAAGQPRAVELWNQWKPTNMTAYPNLTDDQIASLLLYIDGVYTGTYGVTAGDGAVAAATDEGSGNNRWLYIGVFGFLFILSVILTRVVSRLRYLSELKEGLDPEKPKSFLQVMTSRNAVGFLILIGVILGGYTTLNNGIALNRQQNYQPDQPIKFSHETHAGINQIECQYCHDGARRSKHSVIPAANTCMNCHKAIKKGSKYGTGELTKIYASMGYDPIKDVYIEDYDDYSEADIKKLYTTWMTNEYIKDNDGKLDRKGERLVEEQWNELVSSLTSDVKDEIQGPIEWVRIHNMPDHVYFNHAQHVTAGQIECQECHGPVEEMEVAYQYSPLSMGWCINCHRKTEVQFASNPYYESYEKYHLELNTEQRTGVTVEEIGGLECQKCHY